LSIGFCGLGGMGSAITERLIAQGHHLNIWNRTPDRAAPLVALGATQAKTPAGIASTSDIVLTCLFDDAALNEVYAGPEGLLSGNCADTLFIDTSTVRADTLIALAEQARAKGAALLECPIAGPPPAARAGNLLGFTGGTGAEMARARPVLEAFCRKVLHMGALGTGNRMKLAVNLPLLVYFTALGEALSLVRDVPVDPRQIIELLGESPGGANVMKLMGPLIADAWIEGKDPGGFFSVSAVRKDVRLMLAAAERSGLSLPVTRSALDSYDEAVDAGWADRPFFTQALYRRGGAAQ